MKTTTTKIVSQGFPLLSDAAAKVSHSYPDLVLVSFDMQTKWCEIACTSTSHDGTLGLMIDATDRATQTVYGRDMTDDDHWTEVEFPEFKGWDIAMCECRRYTVQVLFTRSTT